MNLHECAYHRHDQAIGHYFISNPLMEVLDLTLI